MLPICEKYKARFSQNALGFSTKISNVLQAVGYLGLIGSVGTSAFIATETLELWVSAYILLAGVVSCALFVSFARVIELLEIIAAKP